MNGIENLKTNAILYINLTNLELRICGERTDYSINNAGIIDRSLPYSIYKNEF